MRCLPPLFSPLIFETGSLIKPGDHCLGWTYEPVSSSNPPVSTSSSTEVPGLHVDTQISTRVLGIQTQVLVFVRQMLYPLNHSSRSPSVNFMNGFQAVLPFRRAGGGGLLSQSDVVVNGTFSHTLHGSAVLKERNSKIYLH